MKANYGIDAPSVVRNLFLASLVMAILAFLSLSIQKPLWFWIAFLYTVPTSLGLFGMGCWMLYSSKVTKPKIVEKMLNDLKLKGDETVLDIGCGRGLLICQAAKRLPHGKVFGIDLWCTKDQSGNSLDATRQNVEREGVELRVVLQTGDARALPFPDNTFDAVVSSLCLHNIKLKGHREQALSEILRVLKPQGKFAILDILKGHEYTAFMKHQLGANVSLSKPNFGYCPPATIVEGNKLC